MISEATRRYVRAELIQLRADRDVWRRRVIEETLVSSWAPPTEKIMDWDTDNWDSPDSLWGL